MAYKICENCGSRIFEYGCVNCDEEKYISMQNGYKALILTDEVCVSGQLPERWKPCGEGENICNCKKASECGYIKFYKGIARLMAEGNFR